MLTSKNKEFRWYLEFFGMKSKPQFFLPSMPSKNYDLMLGINNKHLSTKSHNFISYGHPQFSLVLKSTYFVEKKLYSLH